MVRYSRCPVMFLIYFLTALLSSFLALVSANLADVFNVRNVSFQPPFLTALKEGRSESVSVFVTLETSIFDGPPKNFTLKYAADDPVVAWTSDENEANFLEITPENASKTTKTFFLNTSFGVGGLFLGKTKILLHVTTTDDDEKKSWFVAGYDVWVIRDNKKMQHIFVGTLSILLIIANVLMGAQLNLSIVLEVIKKPLAPFIGFFCQYLFMPLVSYGLARFIFAAGGFTTLGLGMFTTGCCPGGGASNGYTCLLDGNVDLSITMTFVSTVAALAMMPLWMFVLGRHFLPDLPGYGINIPYKNIFYSLLMLVAPLFVGVLIRRFLSKWAEKMKTILRPFLIVIIVFICTFGIYVNLYMFRLMTVRVLLGGLALPWLGFAFGTLSAAICRQPRPNLVAIAIETGIQNTGIAIMLLQLSFPQPDADLASVVPVVVAIFTPPPLIVALIVHYVLKYRREKEKEKEKRLDDEENGSSTTNEKDNSKNNYDQFTLSSSDSAKPLVDAEQNGDATVVVAA